jgi:hypothetical protein
MVMSAHDNDDGNASHCARREYERLVEGRKQALKRVNRLNWLSLACLLVLSFVGLGVGRIWGTAMGLGLVTLAAIAFLAVSTINLPNVIRWQRLAWQAAKARQRLRACEREAPITRDKKL